MIIRSAAISCTHDFYRHIGFTEVKTQKKFLKKMK
ncbi:Ribosomal protein S18 acetylase RimI and related acetyltransferases (RimI) [Fructobacillus fructosus]|nr:Ribosomal protein S18 acetylase RimI and related acetyltransferases (RimI) [Fructobacillus fructosus]CAK1228424.1 Ribosomal protein S18 acetylase RimI and related acetyltransferases (RimI) [Fructobacillus fructosus]CAK1228568.1 Ribosomal protein S18 acetylase RimI and related acetyltransferases (RimI) [Fructobacillus fructosus]